MKSEIARIACRYVGRLGQHRTYSPELPREGRRSLAKSVEQLNSESRLALECNQEAVHHSSHRSKLNHPGHQTRANGQTDTG